MRNWLEKKSVKAVLVLALIVVWGYNSYSIVEMTNEEETAANQNQELNVNLSELKVPDNERFTYNANFRDPFEPELRKRVRKKPPKKRPKKKVVRIPHLQLTGIVEEMALIKNQRKQLFFVSTGDSVEGARVRFVTEDSVGLVFKEKEFNLKFNN